ncbi:uncharacterized protein LOC132268531 [Cornus florida]|uniref:uncharacterized protein LOC132268531 n=1 Tax=Cornus florida TaxID=4283 RepID=UPI00289E5F5E|nr:uncharacterized protein LOC132268531 [Cornus florida]
MAIDNVFSTHGLSIFRLRGQGYDGTSNMQGKFNGLKTLILKENEIAFNVHCFAHQLQLALVAVAKNHDQISTFFVFVVNVVNVVGASCKRRDMLREKQIVEVIDGLNKDGLTSGQGLNQSTSLIRAGDTRWGSHYDTLISLITLFSSVIAVLEFIEKDGLKSDQRGETSILLGSIQSFNFVFNLHLIKTLLGMITKLSKPLQIKDQDIVNAMELVKVCKQRLQMMKDDGCDSLLDKVYSFCERHEIDVPNMDHMFITQG